MSGSKPTQLTPFGAALAGALGACFSNAVVYPLDVAKTRLQASHNDRKNKKAQGLISILIKILKEEGISGYYKGFSATMLNTFSMQYAYFFFYSLVRTAYIKKLTAKLPKASKAPVLSTAAELLLGALAGALAQIFTIPVAVIATRQQIGRSLDRRRSPRSTPKSIASDLDLEKSPLTDTSSLPETEEDPYDDSFLGVAKEIIEEEGVTGLWLGIKPGLVLTVNPAITYGLYERVKNVVLLAAGSNKLSPWTTFTVGALTKTLATVVTYPYIMAKIRIQARSADIDDAKEEHYDKPQRHQYHHDKHQHVGALDILARVWRKEGPLGWYQGMGAQITKAVISQALLFLSKEQFEHWTLAIMIIFYRLRRQRS